jgi:hypothetical protein
MMHNHDDFPGARRFRGASGDPTDDNPRGRGHRGGPGFGRGRGFGRPGGWQQADLPSADDSAAWLTGRLPAGWFTAAPTVQVDREEITVIGELAAPETGAPQAGSAQADSAQEGSAQDGSAQQAAAIGRIQRFREESREQRMQIANEAEARYGRKLAWGASIGETQVLFTHLAVPVMTRLRQNERQVLDTLVDAGVARSRSEALAWCVKLVGEHTDEWLAGLREAMSQVDKLRTEGPSL